MDQARQAHARGDGWFEVEFDLRGTGSLNPYGTTGVDGRDVGLMQTRPTRGRMDILSAIESEGWLLEHVSHVYVQLGEESRNKYLSSGQRVAIRGKIIGIYLFRRRPDATTSDAYPSGSPPTEPPTRSDLPPPPPPPPPPPGYF